MGTHRNVNERDNNMINTDIEKQRISQKGFDKDVHKNRGKSFGQFR